MLVDQRYRSREIGKSGRSEAIGDHGRRDIDAVKNIADVVKHTVRHLCHAGLPRGIDELFVQLGKLRFRVDALGDIPRQNQPAWTALKLDLVRGSEADSPPNQPGLFSGQ